MNQLLQLVQEINQTSFLYLNDDDVEHVRARAHNPAEYKPSGARGSDQGVSDDRQGILSAQITQDGFCCVLKITMLAAGFVVGPHGSTIRTVCDMMGSKSISWCQNYGEDQLEEPLDARVCLIKGPANSIYQTILIIRAAVQRYQDLVLGKCEEKVVRAEQIIEGVTFIYKPPPSKAMPDSARIASRKSKKNRRNAAQKKMQVSQPQLQFHQPQSNLAMNQLVSRVGDLQMSEPIHSAPRYIYQQEEFSPYNSMSTLNSVSSQASIPSSPSHLMYEHYPTMYSTPMQNRMGPGAITPPMHNGSVTPPSPPLTPVFIPSSCPPYVPATAPALAPAPVPMSMPTSVPPQYQGWGSTAPNQAAASHLYGYQDNQVVHYYYYYPQGQY